MKDLTISFVRAQIDSFETGSQTERECLQNILDLCIERIVDLDGGRDDQCVTGTFDRSQFTSILVEETVLAQTPSLPVMAAVSSSGSIEIDLTDEALEDDGPEPCPSKGIVLRNDETGDSFTVHATQASSHTAPTSPPPPFLQD